MAHFPHSLATNLRSLGVDIKVAQELMRHSSSRTTLDVYTRAIDQQEREASLKVMELMLPLEIKKLQHPRRSCKKNGGAVSSSQKGFVGGPDRDRTDDLIHAIPIL
ncbi:short-subunit dehydrogenase involved in D-alanine esterification of teichoic acids [Silvibacterium bohemicum]|uniref:Short-subunit dehydrogenase involved in D-alanine esterification of teichoic acids n=1 Tax=Silvibacterium bohemicum TaxID=1577686 RepID=A0A841JSY1_9BACT|nr:tyrosine-type recombinase/integrase [Silvibacterium bohemicum]MBB6144513.1 short-subunit dehydrogenase involved in D-alanine esterification of teichoic acids [Silvibacterium bohemicum]